MAKRQRKNYRKEVRPSLKQVSLGRPAEHYAVAGLALLGLVLSVYLLYLYYSGSRGVFCAPGSGCDVVRVSPYSQVLGLPVSLIGILGYGTILAFSLRPFSTPRKRLFLYSLALAGFTYSLYLTYLELFVIKAICPYCVASAALSTGILAVLLLQRPRLAGLSPKGLVSISIPIIALVVIGSILAPNRLSREKVEESYAAGLAQHLTANGAVMYGAWWCPHCNDQKELFGTAFRYINYVECDPQGKNPQLRLCREKGITGYPTWEINNRFYPGRFSLGELAILSGYKP